MRQCLREMSGDGDHEIAGRRPPDRQAGRTDRHPAQFLAIGEGEKMTNLQRWGAGDRRPHDECPLNPVIPASTRHLSSCMMRLRADQYYYDLVS